MSPRSPSFLVLFVFISAISSSLSEAATSRPSALVAQVTRDSSTLQYATQIQQKTPLQTERLVVDITGDYLWVQCRDGSYNSSTFRPARCRSAVCSKAGSIACGECYAPPEPGCNNNTCGVFPENTVTRTQTSGDLGQDVVALSSTDGKNPGPKVTVPLFIFSCAPAFLLKGLAQGVAGMAGLSRGNVALPSQLSGAFSFSRKFAICLPSASAPGVVFFGNGPYVLLPGKDVSQGLTYTPLVKNPDLPNQYFINVKAVQVGEKNVAIDSAKLKIDSEGKGGTKLSTVVPYTTVATSVYTAIRDAFVKEAEARNISRVAGVKPFDACFDAKTVSSTRVGAGVPTIGLVLQNSNTIWRIMGANSMVQVSDGVLCLGFVDGGEDPTTTIVIGGHQIEDNLLQFDLATSRLGFSSTLLGMQTTCSNFNFTSTA
ncbi:hypothetical protein SUGI_0109730 [Cryptomeria japonica]|uniref:probable aspartic proteinase GIP2 n=1 Tax=Cryptomeria japonica TaxID=3369 RepID=UPI0024089C19|nr:probable aspartic proteinase GIP2 [Cryptomeria japonica]GLJ09435.1 hypothetical protein SUGI_0109730 [Cryptomeria japonica]